MRLATTPSRFDPSRQPMPQLGKRCAPRCGRTTATTAPRRSLPTWPERSETHFPVAILELSIRRDIPSLEGQPVGYVEGLYIKPDARGGKLGRQLLQESRNWARGQHCVVFASDRAGRIVIDRTFS